MKIHGQYHQFQVAPTHSLSSAKLASLVALPFVVLVTIMAQPRLQYAMAKDGILPATFAQRDDFGNPLWGLKVSGVLMKVVAALVPFAHLDDLISSGILIAFTITDASVILLVRQKSPAEKPSLLKSSLLAFVVGSLLSGFLLWVWIGFGRTGGGICILTVLSCFTTAALGYIMATKCERVKETNSGLFLTPFVPVLPLAGIFINLYLISQLESTGLVMISGYIGISVGSYWYVQSDRETNEWRKMQKCFDRSIGPFLSKKDKGHNQFYKENNFYPD
jgi:amino acid transporter